MILEILQLCFLALELPVMLDLVISAQNEVRGLVLAGMHVFCGHCCQTFVGRRLKKDRTTSKTKIVSGLCAETIGGASPSDSLASINYCASSDCRVRPR